jgi:ketosteroid isomerase-like protein
MSDRMHAGQRWRVFPAQIVEHVFKVLADEWNDYHMTPDTLIDGGECIVGIGSYSGTCKRTGKAMQASVAHVWKLAGGRIVSFEQFTDTLRVAEAMGDTASISSQWRIVASRRLSVCEHDRRSGGSRVLEYMTVCFEETRKSVKGRGCVKT